MQPEPVEPEPQYQLPGPSEPAPVKQNIIRPKSVAELTEMVLVASAKKNLPTRRPSAGPSKPPQGDAGHVKPVANETTVAFGRTTKLKDTIQGVKPVNNGPVRALVGTAKEVENLKKTIESQQSKINDNEAQIAALKSTCENQQSVYVQLLDTCDILLLRMSDLETKLALLSHSSGSEPTTTRNNPVNDAPSTSTAAFKNRIPMDSVALVKGNNNDNIRIKPRETDRTLDDARRNRENAQTPPPQPIVAVSQRTKEQQYRRQKRKDDMNRTIEKLNQTKDELYQNKENRYRGNKKAYRGEYERDPDSQPLSGRYKEKVTFERECLYSPGRNAEGEVLSTTIESTLRRDGPNGVYEHRAKRQQSLRCPQVDIPSDSEDETGYDDDDYRGHDGGHNAVSGIFAPPQRRHHGDGPMDIQYTVMPDVFEDEFESEEEPAPVPKEQHRGRQKVADRLGRNYRN
uniref:SHUGOSHIN 2-like n=1 Tax=Panagrellus redivivus TaxID=6233 RepID=A0A7E4V168_PANRE